MQKLALVFF